jgi:type IV pilus assembly protein PilE
MMISRTRKVCQAGFTLMEMMIVIAILGILIAIALPNYADYVMRSKIIDGTTKLGDFRSRMEKYYFDNRTYQNGANCGIPDPLPGGSDTFAVTCRAPTATTYIVTATGIPAKGMDALFVYTVTETNAKASSGPTGWTGSGTCWAIRKDGTC